MKYISKILQWRGHFDLYIIQQYIISYRRGVFCEYRRQINHLPVFKRKTIGLETKQKQILSSPVKCHMKVLTVVSLESAHHVKEQSSLAITEVKCRRLQRLHRERKLSSCVLSLSLQPLQPMYVLLCRQSRRRTRNFAIN